MSNAETTHALQGGQCANARVFNQHPTIIMDRQAEYEVRSIVLHEILNAHHITFRITNNTYLMTSETQI